MYSNFGAAVDITAPGGDSALGKGTYAVLSTWNNGTALGPPPPSGLPRRSHGQHSESGGLSQGWGSGV